MTIKQIKILVIALFVAIFSSMFVIFVGSASAEDLDLVVVSETETTITFSYAAVSGAEGYRYYTGTYSGSVVTYKAVARTFNAGQLQVKFSKGAEAYRVAPLDVSERVDGYSLLSRAACNDKIDNDADGKIDYPADPGCVRKNDTSEFNDEEPPPPPPPPNPTNGTGNLWVDTNGGSCIRVATASTYVDAQACNSFAAAYTAAISGDTIGVAAGSYPNQFFAGGVGASQSPGNKTLLFRGEIGNRVRQIHFGSPNMTFDGIVVNAGATKTSGAAFENGGRSFVFKNGSIGNVVDEKGALITGTGAVLDNVMFHDVVLRGAGVHLECIMFLSAERLILRNSTFRNCGIMDISVGIADWWTPLPPPYGNVTIENNWFGNSRFDNGGCCATYSVALWATQIPSGNNFGQLNGWTIRNNYIEPGSDVIVRPTVGTGTIICGNTGNAPSSWRVTC